MAVLSDIIFGVGVLLAIVAFGLGYRVVAKSFSFARVLLTRPVPTGRARDRLVDGGGQRRLSVFGRVTVAAPAVSPTTRTPCLAYRLEVTGRIPGGRGSDPSAKLLTLVGGAEFEVDDGSGPVGVDLRTGRTHGEWGGLEYTCTAPFGAIVDGVADRPVTLGEYTLEFSDLDAVFHDAPGIDSIRCTEKVIPLLDEAFVCATAVDGALRDGDYQGVILRDAPRRKVLWDHAFGVLLEVVATCIAVGLAWAALQVNEPR